MKIKSKLKIIIVIFVLFLSAASFADEIDDFIEDSRSEDRRVRADYAELLGNYKDERVFKRLIELVQDEDNYVRWKAANSLAKLGDKRAIPTLKEVIKRTRGDEGLRHYIGEALYELGDESLIPFWIECLEEQDRYLTELFVQAIVKYDYRGKEASDILIRDLKHENEWVKRCAAYALAYTKEIKAYEELLKLLVDSSGQVRQVAILALGHIGNKEATPYLLLALNDENDLVRIAAYHSLYRLADPRSTYGLIEAVNTEKDNYLRQYAIVVLGKTKSKIAIPVLLSILDEKLQKRNFNKMALKADAIKALGEIGDKKPKKRLEEFFKEMTSADAPHFHSSGGGGGGRGGISPYIPYLDKSFPLTSRVSNSPLVFQRFSEDRILSDPLYKNNMGVIIKKSLQKIESAEKKLPPIEFTKIQYDAWIENAKIKLEGFKPAYLDSLVDQLKNSENVWQRVEAAKNLSTSENKKAVLFLIEALDDPNEHVRAEAANSLGLIGDKKAISPLKEKLKDKEEIVRRRAAEALALIADSNNDTQLLEEILLGKSKEISFQVIGALGIQERENCIPVLIKCLHSDDKETKKRTLWAINKIGKKEIAPELHFLLEDKDAEIRNETIRILGYFHDKSVVDKLIQMYDQSDVKTKSAIISSLRYIKDPRAVPLLKKALKDENERIKSQASAALKGLAREDALISLDQIKADLESGDFDLEKNAIKTLSSLVSRSGNHEAFLILNSALKHKDIRIKRLAALSIEGSNPEAIPILIDVLKDKRLIKNYIILNKVMRGEIAESECKLSTQDMEEASAITSAIITLSVYGPPEAKGIFSELLSRDLDEQTLLIQGLGKMGDESSIDVIKPFLMQDGTRKEAMIALGKLGDNSVLSLLVKQLNKEHIVDNIELCKAFIGIGKPAVDYLIKALDSPKPETRELAIHALGQIRDKSATPYLINLIDENNPKLTSDVILALGSLGDKEALPTLIELYKSKKIDLRREILFAFAGLPDISIKPLLLEAARDENSGLESRCLVIQTLGKIKDEEIISFLENLLKNEDGLIKLTAAYALCKTGKFEYESYLIEGLQDKNFSDSAILMLIDLKGDNALPLIEETIKDKSEAEKELMRSFLRQMIYESKKSSK